LLLRDGDRRGRQRQPTLGRLLRDGTLNGGPSVLGPHARECSVIL
jgi:hypothetical protein